MYKESNIRSILKSILWRVTGTLTGIVIVFILTREIKIALGFGVAELILKMLIYYFYERVWNKIRFGKHELKSFVLWLTGLPGAGKSTIAARIAETLEKRACKVEVLSDENLRSIFPHIVKDDKISRIEQVEEIGYYCARIESHGIWVIAPFASPYREARQFVRNVSQNFIEVYVATPLDECKKRDGERKGLYKLAREGKIENFTEHVKNYETPENPDVVINLKEQTEDEAYKEVMKVIDRYF